MSFSWSAVFGSSIDTGVWRSAEYAADVRTLHVGLRVGDIDRSLTFYRALGYRVIGSVAGTGLGDLTMLALPHDPFVSLELVHRPGDSVAVSGISHLVVRVESLSELAESLSAHGIDIEDRNVHDPDSGFTTGWITDPDGYRIEVVQWPAGHPDGMTAGDFDQAP